MILIVKCIDSGSFSFMALSILIRKGSEKYTDSSNWIISLYWASAVSPFYLIVKCVSVKGYFPRCKLQWVSTKVEFVSWNRKKNEKLSSWKPLELYILIIKLSYNAMYYMSHAIMCDPKCVNEIFPFQFKHWCRLMFMCDNHYSMNDKRVIINHNKMI